MYYYGNIKFIFIENINNIEVLKILILIFNYIYIYIYRHTHMGQPVRFDGLFWYPSLTYLSKYAF